MKRLRHLSAEGKITIALAVMFVMVVAVLLLANSGLRSMQKAEVVFEGGNQMAMDLLQLKDKLTRQREQMLRMMMASTPAEKRALEAGISDRSREIDLLLDNVMAEAQRDPELAGKLRELQAVREASRQTRETQVIPLIRAGKTAQARSLLLGVQQQRFDRIRTLAKELCQKAEDQAQEQAASMRRNAERSTNAFMLAIIVFLLSAGAVMFMLQGGSRQNDDSLAVSNARRSRTT